MIVFDLETTGLPKAEGSGLSLQPKMIEFGGIKLNDETLEEIDRLEFLVNPGHELEPVITKITGIKDSDLKDKESFAGHYHDLCEFFLGERAMCAHNLGFDRQILKFDLERIDKVTAFPWPMEHTCTVEVGQQVWGRMRKLGEIYQEITGREIEGAHRSIADVEATIEVVKWYKAEGYL